MPIIADSDIVSGTPVFEGTRVPVQTLFDYLMDGGELVEFLDNFPSMSQAAALAILDYVGSQITRAAVA